MNTPLQSHLGNEPPLRKLLPPSVALILFAAFAFGVDRLILSSIPLVGLARIVAVSLAAWLFLKISPIFLCIAILVRFGVQPFSTYPEIERLTAYVDIPLCCGLLVWRSLFHEVRYRAIQWTKSWGLEDPNVEPMATDRKMAKAMATQALRWSLVFLGIAMCASALLGINPLGTGHYRWVEWSSASHQVFWPGPTLLTLLGGTALLFREWWWRDKTKIEAQLLLRSESIRVHYDDLLRFARYQLWNKSKGRSRSKKEPG